MALPTPPRPAPIILLVDDNDALRELMRMALHDRGYQVETCAAGGEAIALAHKLPAPPDLLITDIGLGELSGPDMAAQLRADFPKLKLLFMSGYPGAVAAFQSTAALSDGSFLSKPFSLQLLFQRVTEILSD